MILFKDIEHSDKEIITSYTMNSSRQGCEISFSNLCCWQFIYNIRFAIVDGYLLLKSRTGNILSYMMPIGNGDLKRALDALIEDAHREGVAFCLANRYADMRADLDALMPNQFQFTIDYDSSDYIYLRSDLANLVGSRFQAKRNHVNKFKRTYRYDYTELTPDCIQECLELEDVWCKVNARDGEKGVDAERKALTYALSNFEALGLQGGVLRVEGKIVAFTFGMPISQQTFGIHAEKADASFAGAYAMINYEFANRIPEQYIYINREEDLGIEGLRKAKLSYHPVVILEKHIAYLKESQSQRSNGKQLVKMQDKVKDLWKLCFNASDEFVELYFRWRYSDDVNLATLNGDEVIGAMQMLPYPMTFFGKEVNMVYFSGVCTHPNFRNKGVMRKLLSQAFAQMLHKGTLLSTLIPEEPWLFDYYASMGYTPTFKREKKIVGRSTTCLTSNHSVESNLEVKEEHCKYLDKKLRGRSCAILHTFNDYQTVVAALQLFQGKIYSITQEGSITALAFASPDEKGGWCISEVMADTPMLGEALIQQIIIDTGVQEIELLLSGSTGQNSHPFGMLRIIDAKGALQLYAATHPEVEMSIVLSDEQVSLNNGYYYLSNGKCITSKERLPDRHQELTINQLAEMIFAESSPYMSLMLD